MIDHHTTPIAGRLNHMAGRVRGMDPARQATGQMQVLADFILAVADQANRVDVAAAVRLERLAGEIRGRADPFAPYSGMELQYLAARMAGAAGDLAVAEGSAAGTGGAADGGGNAA